VSVGPLADCLEPARAPLLLWLLRERHFFGDALFVMLASLSDFRFAVPDIGSFYLFALAMRSAQALGIDPTWQRSRSERRCSS
jgi:hypothetical protein